MRRLVEIRPLTGVVDAEPLVFRIRPAEALQRTADMDRGIVAGHDIGRNPDLLKHRHLVLPELIVVGILQYHVRCILDKIVSGRSGDHHAVECGIRDAAPQHVVSQKIAVALPGRDAGQMGRLLLSHKILGNCQP